MRLIEVLASLILIGAVSLFASHFIGDKEKGGIASRILVQQFR